MKLRMKRWLYFALGAFACIAPIAVDLLQAIVPALRSDLRDIVFVSAGFQSLAVLTYPAGILGVIVSLATIYLGLLTPAEALLLAGAISLTLGYLQWYVVIPRIFGGADRR